MESSFPSPEFMEVIDYQGVTTPALPASPKSLKLSELCKQEIIPSE